MLSQTHNTSQIGTGRASKFLKLSEAFLVITLVIIFPINMVVLVLSASELHQYKN